MKRALVFCLLVGLAVGCKQETKIDATSKESIAQSVNKIEKELPPEEFDLFKKSLMQLTLSNMNIFRDALDPDGAIAKMSMKIHGKTAREIIAEAAPNRDMERLNIEQEIESLKEKKKNSHLLEGVEVLKAKFSNQVQRIGSKPEIYLKLKNGSKHALSRVYYNGESITPGRSIPWIKEDFNQSIRGGLEPGELDGYYFEPNMFSEWGKAYPDKNAKFHVIVKGAEMAINGEIKEVMAFTKEDARRLEELEKLYGSQGGKK